MTTYYVQIKYEDGAVLYSTYVQNTPYKISAIAEAINQMHMVIQGDINQDILVITATKI